jgi:hypothetical protein
MRPLLERVPVRLTTSPNTWRRGAGRAALVDDAERARRGRCVTAAGGWPGGDPGPKQRPGLIGCGAPAGGGLRRRRATSSGSPMKITPFAIERYFARYEFSARYLLSSSDLRALTQTESSSGPMPRRRALGPSASATPSRRARRSRGCEIAGLYAGVDADEVLEIVRGASCWR